MGQLCRYRASVAFASRKFLSSWALVLFRGSQLLQLQESKLWKAPTFTIWLKLNQLIKHDQIFVEKFVLQQPVIQCNAFWEYYFTAYIVVSSGAYWFQNQAHIAYLCQRATGSTTRRTGRKDRYRTRLSRGRVLKLWRGNSLAFAEFIHGKLASTNPSLSYLQISRRRWSVVTALLHYQMLCCVDATPSSCWSSARFSLEWTRVPLHCRLLSRFLLQGVAWCAGDSPRHELGMHSLESERHALNTVTSSYNFLHRRSVASRLVYIPGSRIGQSRQTEEATVYDSKCSRTSDVFSGWLQ